MKFSKTAAGYAAGILAGISYGLNPLFGKPLLEGGVSVLTMLFFRYFISTVILGGWMLLRHERFRINRQEFILLALLGLLFSSSSLFLFDSYKYMPSGLATTVVYIYPVLVALLMVFLKVKPTWQVWVSIAATLLGVVILCKPSDGVSLNWLGLTLAFLSALSYAIYLVIVNRSSRIRRVSEHTLTFYALAVGSVLFLTYYAFQGGEFFKGLGSFRSIVNLTGLAVFPTMISLLTLAVATRHIGPTKTSILGVAEPVTAILIGTLVFSEPMTVSIAVGITVCIGGIVFMIVSEKQGGNAPKRNADSN
ncbi:MAG: DMT family transporter [Candidatus Cryptobacteroides sp.]